MARRSTRTANALAEGASGAVGGRAEPVLAVAWLLTGAVQYIGAHQRMLLLTGRRPWLEALALVDLSGVYVILVVATVLCLVLRAMRSRGVSSTR